MSQKYFKGKKYDQNPFLQYWVETLTTINIIIKY